MASLTDTVSEGLKNAGVEANKIKDALTNNELLNSITNAASNISKQVQATMTQGANMLNASLESISGSFPEATTAFFNKTTSDANALTQIAGTVAKGSKEVDAKLKTLASDSSEAAASAVAFVTKPISDTIKSASTMTQGSGMTNMLNGLDPTSIANVGKSLGTNITSSSDLSDAIKSVTNSISDTVKGATDTLKELKVSTVEKAVSTVKDYSGSLMNGISSTVGSVTGEGTLLGGIIDGGKTLTTEVLDMLPNSAASWLTRKSDTFINDTAQKILGDKTDLVGSLLNKLPGVEKTDNFLEKVLALGDSSTYSLLADETGSALTSLYGSADGDTIHALYLAAKDLCGGINVPSYYTFRNNKDLYDMLLQVAAELGATDLINQLKRCAATMSKARSLKTDENNPYWDERSVRILQEAAEPVARRGTTASWKI